jgi:hypothetical protein
MLLAGGTREMRQKSYAAAFMMVFVGLGLFGSLARSPSFHTYRTFDIVSLVVVGVCFGYAAASIESVWRSLAEKR